MAWEFKDQRPIYIQLIEQIKLKIISGEYKPGQKFPTVRELAEEASVNPNTIQKALAELERSGFVYSQRTSGRFITEDIDMIKEIKLDIAKDQAVNFLKSMKSLGLSNEDIMEFLGKMAKEMK
ncbi:MULTISPECIES: GntR family transcriptional regulator [Clostridium]|uniref:GntR family transcriptional regulator n=1 Tax=Clostridium sulfidigenes TaxID=318464 RepID=A0A084J7Q3_9CLOT|nr:GntR family transcriptional regulator [Clostridium sulfidigenes]KEZ84987.1 GntR family transcriptional regulator [Clostridium sulfidigenes]HBA04727.1 GntR family transcriptional regulator [Clostridium sp.]HCO73261.1 GntR family transcriptional regulator [Clostridium sp.]